MQCTTAEQQQVAPVSFPKDAPRELAQLGVQLRLLVLERAQRRVVLRRARLGPLAGAREQRALAAERAARAVLAAQQLDALGGPQHAVHEALEALQLRRPHELLLLLLLRQRSRIGRGDDRAGSARRGVAAGGRVG